MSDFIQSRQKWFKVTVVDVDVVANVVSLVTAFHIYYDVDVDVAVDVFVVITAVVSIIVTVVTAFAFILTRQINDSFLKTFV